MAQSRRHDRDLQEFVERLRKQVKMGANGSTEQPPVQPVQPRVQPERPRVQPVQPRVQPEQPRVQPVQPRVQPERPRVQPVRPRVQPEQPRVQPVQPRVQPEQLRAEKCYDPGDPTLRFVDTEDELDFLCEGFTSRRALMSCGHAVTPTSLTNWCRRLLDQGESRFTCGQSGCTVEWPYTEVCKMALLTPEEREYFEKALASNARKDILDTKSCPGCKSSMQRKKASNLRVRCSVCTATNGRSYAFCWQCLREWKGPYPRADRCENDGCCNESLKTLKNCPDIVFESVKGVTGCPTIRACPTCGSLVEHSRRHCKSIVCPRCRVKFCFVCLKLAEECFKTSGISAKCSSGVAPRQTSIPVWRRK